MSRPSTHADLPTYAHEGTEIARIQLGDAPPTSGFLKAVAAMTDAAGANQLTVSNSNGTITISRPKSTEDLDEALQRAQSEWDANLDTYNAWLADGVPEGISQWRVGAVLSWARKDATSDDLNWLEEAHRDAKLRDAAKS